MVKVKKDLKGKQFGHLIVIDQVEDYVNPKGFHFSQWLCQCECGQTTITRGAHLIDGTTQSCGCLKKQKLNNRKLNNKFDLNGDFGIGYTTKGENRGMGLYWADELVKKHEIMHNTNITDTEIAQEIEIMKE